MSDTTSFALLGTFKGFGKGDKGPGYGIIVGEGSETKVKVWPTVKDFREKPPVEGPNPAFAPAEEQVFGLWTGYSKLEEWTDKRTDLKVTGRVYYVTGFESQDPPQAAPNSWAEPEEAAPVEEATVEVPAPSTASTVTESKDALIHAAMELLEKALAG